MFVNRLMVISVCAIYIHGVMTLLHRYFFKSGKLSTFKVLIRGEGGSEN